MKSEDEVRSQLEQVYRHRLSIRVDRYTKPMCRNCVNGISREFDLGDFGTISRWECRDSRKCCDGCGFRCRWTEEDIENKMIEDISDPAVCGAKEPKIAMLLWVLHKGGGVKGGYGETPVSPSESGGETFWQKIRGMFFE